MKKHILPALAVSKTAVAEALGVTVRHLNEQQPVSAELAVRFGKLFGNGAAFWANLQRSHDLAVAERTVDVTGIPALSARGTAEEAGDQSSGGLPGVCVPWSIDRLRE